MRTDVNGLKGGLEEVRAGQVVMERRLGRVEVVQEEMRDLIRQIAEGHAATQDLVRRESTETRAMIDRRLLPLEESVRQLWRRVDGAPGA